VRQDAPFTTWRSRLAQTSFYSLLEFVSRQLRTKIEAKSRLALSLGIGVFPASPYVYVRAFSLNRRHLPTQLRLHKISNLCALLTGLYIMQMLAWGRSRKCYPPTQDFSLAEHSVFSARMLFLQRRFVMNRVQVVSVVACMSHVTGHRSHG
jgi:hypothetical protein